MSLSYKSFAIQKCTEEGERPSRESAKMEKNRQKKDKRNKKIKKYKMATTDIHFEIEKQERHLMDIPYGEDYIFHEVFQNLYIGRGFKQEIKEKKHHITHIIKTVVFSYVIDLSDYKVLSLDILDKEQENIIDHFEQCIKFIQDCFNADPRNKILIFCQAGISRSATIAAAYLMQTLKISKEDAIALIKKTHPSAQPNSGFIEQLQLFEECNYIPNQEKKQYRQWLLKHKVDVSLKPLIWMKKELDNGNIEGKFTCPKCNSRIGKYAWQGMTCSCKKWITPALSVQKGKIDIVKSNKATL
ncbi:hypothetical protein PMAC_002022 [Pneumocystis sp. 'macacae']|nr:hypothetical protein PMAC_002022 [Pneumocystis sp. 'macacae']